ncbi:MAG TPA: DinB family protein [Vicinamibacterales bacterium]|nr:DinB family protein [Vicinamibacterales bacterium]
MPYSGKDLARSFRTVRKNTIQIANDIPADQWTFRAAPGTRSIQELLAHIAAVSHYPRHIHIIDRRTHLSGPDFGPYVAAGRAYEHTLTSRAAILKALEADGEEFAKELEALTDADLATAVQFAPPIQPPSKTRFELLLGVKEHEMHHRGQLMLLQRMVGVVPHLTREREARDRAQAAAQAGR